MPPSPTDDAPDTPPQPSDASLASLASLASRAFGAARRLLQRSPLARPALMHFGLGLLLSAIPLMRTASAKAFLILGLVVGLTAPLLWLTRPRPEDPTPEARAPLGRLARFVGVGLIPASCLVVASLALTRACNLDDGLAMLVTGHGPGLCVAFGLCEALEGWRVRWRPLWVVLASLAALAWSVAWFLTEPVYQVAHPFAGMLLGPPNEQQDPLMLRARWHALELLGWATTLTGLGWLGRTRAARKAAPAPEGTPLVQRLRPWVAPMLTLLVGLGLAVGLMRSDAELHYRIDRDYVHHHFRLEKRGDDLTHIMSPFIPTDGIAWLRVEAAFQRQRQLDLLKLDDATMPHATVYWFHSRDQKRDLTGARRVKFAKVHLGEFYVSTDTFPPRTVGHELAHITSGAFSDNLLQVPGRLGGLWYNPALVEGFAVAVDWSDKPLSPHEKTRIAIEADRVPPLEDLFSPLGFVSTNLSVAYRASGSFVRYLIDTYGPEPVTVWFGTEDFEGAFNRPLSEVEAEWRAFLEEVPVRKQDTSRVHNVQTRPSIAQERCGPSSTDLDLNRAIEREADAAVLRLMRRTDYDKRRPNFRARAFLTRTRYETQRKNYRCDLPADPEVDLEGDDALSYAFIRALSLWAKGDRATARKLLDTLPDDVKRTDATIAARLLLRDGFKIEDYDIPKRIDRTQHNTALWERRRHPIIGYRVAKAMLRDQRWDSLYTFTRDLSWDGFTFPDGFSGTFPLKTLEVRAIAAFAHRDWDAAIQDWTRYVKLAPTEGRRAYGETWLERTRYFKKHANQLTANLPRF